MQFHATHRSDCGSGLGPMAFVRMGAMSAKAKEQLANNVDNANNYTNQQESDTGRVTAADEKDLAKACGYPVLTSWAECDMQLRQ